jgi:hypothetical protein
MNGLLRSLLITSLNKQDMEVLRAAISRLHGKTSPKGQKSLRRSASGRRDKDLNQLLERVKQLSSESRNLWNQHEVLRWQCKALSDEFKARMLGPD